MFCRFIIISLLFLAQGASSLAQVYLHQVNKRIEELKLKGVDTILYYNKETIGPYIKEYREGLRCLAPEYLVWRLDGKTWIQKYQNCASKVFISSDLEAPPVYSFLHDHFESILHDSLRMVMRPPFHPLMYFLKIFLRDTVINKEVNEYYIRSLYPEYDNREGYIYNRSTKLWQMIDLLDREIGAMEEKKLFR